MALDLRILLVALSFGCCFAARTEHKTFYLRHAEALKTLPAHQQSMYEIVDPSRGTMQVDVLFSGLVKKMSGQHKLYGNMYETELLKTDNNHTLITTRAHPNDSIRRLFVVLGVEDAQDLTCTELQVAELDSKAPLVPQLAGDLKPLGYTRQFCHTGLVDAVCTHLRCSNRKKWGFVPENLEHEWVLTSSAFACKESSDAEKSAPLDGQGGTMELSACMAKCSANKNCAAIDWFKQDGECILYPRGCSRPSYNERGASTWVMAQEVLKKRACASYHEEMAFVGEGWFSTDSPADELLRKFQETFKDNCKSGDEIVMYYAEKDVGYALGNDWASWMKNKVLMNINSEFQLFHSGVRFVGCGKSLMFQLQARSWGLSEEGYPMVTPFGVGFPYPITSPDNQHVWNDLICDIPGKGQRDVGGGNIILYRIQNSNSIQQWIRGESKILSFSPVDVQSFFAQLSPYWSWWNIVSKYLGERITWKKSEESHGTVLREALVCDTFSLWLMAQGLAFAKAANYPAKAFLINVNKEPNYNRVEITIHGHDGKNAPQLGKLEDIANGAQMQQFDLNYAHAMSMSSQARETFGVWETAKGYNACQDWKPGVNGETLAVHDTLLSRDWKDPSTWSSASMNPFAKYDCVNRVMRGPTGIDVVRFGLWRFFHIGKEQKQIVTALDWDVEAKASYTPPFAIFADNGSVQLPGGTPRGPFANDSPENPCGSLCTWEDPVPPAPEGGYTL